MLKTRSNRSNRLKRSCPEATQQEVSLTGEDGAHGGIGVDLEGVHLPLGTEANGFHPHQQEPHGQEADVHELTDDGQPEDAWRQQGGVGGVL